MKKLLALLFTGLLSLNVYAEREHGEILISYADSDEELILELSKHDLKSVRKLDKINTHIVKAPKGKEHELVQELKNNPKVKFVEVNKLIPPGTNDTYFNNAWHLTKINAVNAWNYSTGVGVVVAVLDTGTDTTHPDLITQVVPGRNVVSDNSDTADINGHGTMTAGIVAAATNNGIGVASIAWNAKIMPIRITNDPAGWAYYSDMAEAIIWAADHGARVASMSYAGSASGAVSSAGKYLRDRKGVLVVAAGNSGVDTNLPADENLIVVSATEQTDNRTSWSSFGANVDLSAPGTGIYTTSRGGGYVSMGGTSSSTPITAAIAALVISAHPLFTAKEVDSALINGSVDLGVVGKDPYFGYGRVSAYGALLAANNIIPTPPDTTPPTVQITSPFNGFTFINSRLSIKITVVASDNVELANVKLIINGSTIFSGNVGTITYYAYIPRLPYGYSTISATATDTSGNTKSTSIKIFKQ